MQLLHALIKSLRYTGGDFMFFSGSYPTAACATAATAGHRLLFMR